MNMAGEERNQAASPKRRQEARQRGNLPKSVELSSSAVLVVGVMVIASRIGPTVEQVKQIMSAFILDSGRAELNLLWVQHSFGYLTLTVLQAMLPLLGTILGTVVVVSVAQSGLPTSLKPLVPDFTRLNPITGLGRLLSSRGAIEVLKGLIKIGLLVWLSWSAINDMLARPAAAFEPDTIELFNIFLTIVNSIIKRLAVALLLFGVVDYGYQRYTYEKSLRMTQQEVKEELKETEGNPQIRSRIRQRMRSIASRRMMQQVPKAQVVITNPTHYAIALRYEPPMKAPKVVAKGADLIALRIREIAQDNNVPIVSNPPLDQALYKAVDIEEDIPANLYQAVAEVLAYVYKLRYGRTGQIR
jgi:flagellar biosynthetic protein FlhB